MANNEIITCENHFRSTCTVHTVTLHTAQYTHSIHRLHYLRPPLHTVQYTGYAQYVHSVYQTIPPKIHFSMYILQVFYYKHKILRYNCCFICAKMPILNIDKNFKVNKI